MKKTLAILAILAILVLCTGCMSRGVRYQPPPPLPPEAACAHWARVMTAMEGAVGTVTGTKPVTVAEATAGEGYPSPYGAHGGCRGRVYGTNAPREQGSSWGYYRPQGGESQW